ncbi:hypothetical protein [Pectobacterium phage PcaP1EGY]
MAKFDKKIVKSLGKQNRNEMDDIKCNTGANCSGISCDGCPLNHGQRTIGDVRKMRIKYLNKQLVEVAYVPEV